MMMSWGVMWYMPWGCVIWWCLEEWCDICLGAVWYDGVLGSDMIYALGLCDMIVSWGLMWWVGLCDVIVSWGLWCVPWNYVIRFCPEEWCDGCLETVMWLCLDDCDVCLGTMWCDCVLRTVMWALGLCDVIVSWGLWCVPWDYVMWLCLEDCDVGLGTMWCDCVLRADVMGVLGLCDVIVSWGMWCGPWDYVMWLCLEDCDVGLGTMWCDCVLRTDVMGVLGLCDVIVSWRLWWVPWDYVMWLCLEDCDVGLGTMWCDCVLKAVVMCTLPTRLQSFFPKLLQGQEPHPHLVIMYPIFFTIFCKWSEPSEGRWMKSLYCCAWPYLRCRYVFTIRSLIENI